MLAKLRAGRGMLSRSFAVMIVWCTALELSIGWSVMELGPPSSSSVIVCCTGLGFKIMVISCTALVLRFVPMDEDFRGWDAAAASVLDNAAQCAAKILRREFQRPSTEQQKIKAKNFVHLTKKPTHKEEANTRLRFKTRGRHLGLQRSQPAR